MITAEPPFVGVVTAVTFNVSGSASVSFARTLMLSSGVLIGVVTKSSFATGGLFGRANSFSNMHSAESPVVRLRFSVVPLETQFTRQSDEIRLQFAGTISVTL